MDHCAHGASSSRSRSHVPVPQRATGHWQAALHHAQLLPPGRHRGHLHLASCRGPTGRGTQYLHGLLISPLPTQATLARLHQQRLPNYSSAPTTTHSSSYRTTTTPTTTLSSNYLRCPLAYNTLEAAIKAVNLTTLRQAAPTSHTYTRDARPKPTTYATLEAYFREPPSDNQHQPRKHLTTLCQHHLTPATPHTQRVPLRYQPTPAGQPTTDPRALNRPR